MRNALIGILMAATAATPLAAQDNGWRGRGHDAGEQRSQRTEQRQQAQPRRQQPQQQQQQQQAAPQGQRFQGGWAGRGGAQQQQVAPQGQRFQGGNWAGRRNFQQQAPVQVQPQVQQRQAWQGRGGAGWNGQNRFQGQGNVAYQRNYAPQQDRRVERNRQEWRGGDRRWAGNRDGRARWNRDWRSDRRYDWQRYRYANRSLFHLGPYYAPFRGYYYSPLEIGIALDAAFFAQDYWIDPAYYDLPMAPPGAEWVRYYNDVVLVDMDSGEVLDVIHDFFW
jgi:hypothetical protein